MDTIQLKNVGNSLDMPAGIVDRHLKKINSLQHTTRIVKLLTLRKMNRNDEQLKHLYENKELIIFCEGIDYWNQQVDKHFPHSDTMRVGEKTWLTQRLMYELSKGYYPIEDDDQYIQFKNYGVGIPGKKSRNIIK